MKSKSQQVIDEVNELMRRYEAATTRPKCRSSHAAPAIRTEPDFFKKMFLFMVSELA